MNEIYRGHEIVVVEGSPTCAIIVERRTGIELPTKVTAMPDEGERACLRRARQLIDLYLDALTADEGEGDPGRRENGPPASDKQTGESLSWRLHSR
jgi:hypothetical protein